jgi:MoxR-like ATPase
MRTREPNIEFAERVPELAVRLKREVAQVIVGQESVVEEVLICLLCGGHGLLEGVPGLAKTLLVNTTADALSLDSGRVQFTPDLMPADVTGTIIVEGHTSARSFVFQKGPIFTNVLLADEINRSPPKTQSALLEGMAEGQITNSGTRYALPKPFFVLATQNPIEQEGTYTLPEAQLDRFLMKILVDYPEFDEENQIVRRTTGEKSGSARPVLSRDEVLDLQRVVEILPISPHVLEYATRLARASRPKNSTCPASLRQLIAWGAGPRAGQSLIRAAKARTLLTGRFAVTREDVCEVALPVLRHRVLPSFHAEATGITSDDLVRQLIAETPKFPKNPDRPYDAITRQILRL